MKKILSAALVVLMIFCTFGCSKQHKRSNVSDDDLQKKIIKYSENNKDEPDVIGLDNNKMIDFVNAAASEIKKIGLSDIYSVRVIDFDFDGVPELMVKGNLNKESLYPVSFYKFENGVMKKLDSGKMAIPGNSRLYLFYDTIAKKSVYTMTYRELRTLDSYMLTLSEFTFDRKVTENILSTADYNFSGSKPGDTSAEAEVKYTISNSKDPVSSEEYNAFISEYLKSRTDLRLKATEQVLSGSKLSDSDVKNGLADMYLSFSYNKYAERSLSWSEFCSDLIKDNGIENTGWLLFDGDDDGIPEVYFYNSNGSNAPVYSLTAMSAEAKIGDISAKKLYISFDYNLNKEVLVGYSSTSDGDFTATVYSLKDGKLSPYLTYKKSGEQYSINGNISTNGEVNEELENYINDRYLAKTVTGHDLPAVNEAVTEYFFRTLTV